MTFLVHSVIHLIILCLSFPRIKLRVFQLSHESQKIDEDWQLMENLKMMKI